MNILLANWQDLRNPQAGGAEIHLFEIFSRLAARGHRVRMVCSSFEGAPHTEDVDGIEVHRCGGRFSFTVQSRTALRREIHRETPDIVVDDINKIPLATPKVTRAPVYAIVPHLFGTTVFQEAPWYMGLIVWLAERRIPSIYRQAWFHAISDSTRDDLVHRGIPAERITVVYPGVDTVRYTADPKVPRASPARFVYLGRLRRYKGVDVLIEAMALVRKTHPKVSLDIAGSGDDRARLEGLVQRHGLANEVRFLGFVDEATKVRLLRQAIANVFPSPKEGWGITVMEAAACGTPSLASNSPGLRDSVRDGVTGLLVPHGDAQALATAMLRLVDDPGLVSSLGAAARVHAEHLSWDNAADEVEAHLQHLVTFGSPPPGFHRSSGLALP